MVEILNGIWWKYLTELGGQILSYIIISTIYAINVISGAAIIHADVFLPGGVLRIDKYYNRLVLRNPGTLRLPIEKIYEGGTSRARNPHIQNMLRMIGYGENLGSGFPMIMNAWKQSGWGEPMLENRIDIDEVALILPVQTEKNTTQETGEETGEKTREKTREKIFNAIRENPSITTSELAEKLTITIKGVEWQLKNLRKQGFIRRVSPDKGGHWEVIED